MKEDGKACSMHCNLMFHRYANLLSVRGTTDLRIVCPMLSHRIICMIAWARESIVSVEMAPGMHSPAAGVAPLKQTLVRATMQSVRFFFVIQSAVGRGYLLGFLTQTCHSCAAYPPTPISASTVLTCLMVMLRPVSTDHHVPTPIHQLHHLPYYPLALLNTSCLPATHPCQTNPPILLLSHPILLSRQKHRLINRHRQAPMPSLDHNRAQD